MKNLVSVLPTFRHLLKLLPILLAYLCFSVTNFRITSVAGAPLRWPLPPPQSFSAWCQWRRSTGASGAPAWARGASPWAPWSRLAATTGTAWWASRASSARRTDSGRTRRHFVSRLATHSHTHWHRHVYVYACAARDCRRTAPLHRSTDPPPPRGPAHRSTQLMTLVLYFRRTNDRFRYRSWIIINIPDTWNLKPPDTIRTRTHDMPTDHPRSQANRSAPIPAIRPTGWLRRSSSTTTPETTWASSAGPDLSRVTRVHPSGPNASRMAGGPVRCRSARATRRCNLQDHQRLKPRIRRQVSITGPPSERML